MLWKELIPFIISLLVRHPLIIEKALNQGRPLFENITKNISLEDGRKHNSEIKDIINNFQVDLVSSFTAYNDKFDLDVFNKYASILNSLTGKIMDFSNQKFSLLTSDYPLAAHLTQQRVNNNLVDNLTGGTIILSIPLSPYYVLYIGRELSTMDSKSKHSLVKERNLLSLNNAKFFIYASNLFQKEFIVSNFTSYLDIYNYHYMNDVDFCWQNLGIRVRACLLP